MADMRGRSRTLRAVGPAILLALVALELGACGSDSTDTTIPKRPPVSATTADHLAKLSDRVASELDAGDTCDAAYAADDLRAAVEESDLPATMRPGVDEVAGRLVDEVNCPPPPPPPEPEEKKKGKEKEKDEQDKHQGGDDEFTPPGQAKHGGFVPPGHAKLKGEE
jgi:hypothetical protein